MKSSGYVESYEKDLEIRGQAGEDPLPAVIRRKLGKWISPAASLLSGSRSVRGNGKDIGAGDGIRTRDIDLGKVALYQLSYSRPEGNPIFHQNRNAVKRYGKSIENIGFIMLL